MGKSDKNMAEHVRSVKMWLERAEKSYDHQSDIQGELNLMLAEAEMKNLRKNHMTGQGIMKIVAAVTAVMLFGGAWYAVSFQNPMAHAPAADAKNIASGQRTYIHSTMETVPDVKETIAQSVRQEPMKMDSETEGTTSSMPLPDRQEQQKRQADAVPSAEEYTQTVSVQHNIPEPKTVLTDRQVQEAVQDARHSLRGAAIQNK